MSQHVEFPSQEYPKPKKRAAILTKLLEREMPGASIARKRIDRLADKAERMSAADLKRLVRDAKNAMAVAGLRGKGKNGKSGENGEGMEEGDGKGEGAMDAGDALEEAVEALQKMRDEVESFMKQMYQ